MSKNNNKTKTNFLLRFYKSITALILLAAVAFTTIYITDYKVQGLTEIEKAQNQNKSLQTKLTDIETKIKNAKNKLKNSQNEKEKLQIKAEIEQDEKDRLAAQLLLIYDEIDNLDKSIKDAENTYKIKEEDFYEKARLIYSFSKKSPLEILSESSNIVDFYRRVKLLLLVSKMDKEMLNDLIDQKKEVELKKSLKNENAQKVDKLVTEKELNLKQINLTKKDLESAIASAYKNVSTLENEEEALKKDQNDIKRKIQELEAERKKNGTQTKYTGGIMLWPVPGRTDISSGYGRRRSPISGRSEFHTGLDIPAPRGTSIVAAADGEVIVSGRKGGYGNCVIIDHGGGITTLYGHASALLVKEGQKVRKGTVIAKIGSTGWSTGNHCHFQVMINGEPTNPIPYLTKK